ncbi:unnamed protein product [Alopecurus aequalis]
MELTLVFSLLFLSSLQGVTSDSHITSLFTLGDSYIDAGNFVIMAAQLVPPFPVWHDKPPYGMTFFGHPTGRLSDGRIITDFIAEQFGLPLLGASLLNNSDVSNGVNFAVGGATAIDVDYYERNKLVQFKLLNNSLNVQIGWFEELKPTICNTTKEQLVNTGCGGCFTKALFFVGEFGVNDYNFVWNAGKTEDEVMSYVPEVVKNIAIAVERLINEGAVYVIVPGNPPNGCSPTMLTFRSSLNQTEKYDHMGCLNDMNRVARQHNAMLNASIGVLRGKYPHARIIFADFYKPIISILQSPSCFGVARANALRACCGGGGEYNWNATAVCGMPGVTACKDPSAFISWDGVHYTEAIYRRIVKGWLYGPFADPPILSVIRH